jgi:hypothetical protein
VERYKCTKENPWTKDKGNYAEHPDAVYLNDEDHGGGDCVACYNCPNCGLYFKETLAQ